MVSFVSNLDKEVRRRADGNERLIFAFKALYNADVSGTVGVIGAVVGDGRSDRV